ncbi:MAG: UDP-N-acetylmuramoyl-L-alanine--D-glutamate ligase [Nitrospirae bacterium]|nr:UDP-N-acetylmuramoyl-L-alanine--D-glutamate ligase [Nitrospirota bacterium]
MEEITGLFKDKNVLVVGLARSGVGASNLLACIGANVYATDTKPAESLKENIAKLSPAVKVAAGCHDEELFNNADLIVISPGVPLDMPLLLKAKAKGTPIIGELELAYEILMSDNPPIPHLIKGGEGGFIAITGTNGKSTTTMLVDLMLKEAGFRTLLGGNIGNALTEEIRKALGVRGEGEKDGSFYASRLTPYDFIVAEVSSFQLETIKAFRPKAAAILNITPDHLDRYHSMEEYIDAKARIFENQAEGDYLILNADDPAIIKVRSEKLEVRNERPRTFFFSRQREVEGIYLKDGIIYCNFQNSKLKIQNSKLIAADEIRIKGVHNIENAMAAAALAFACGCSADSVIKALRDFRGLEHRLEFIDKIDGVSFINDSKGTNVGAVNKSLESFESLILIMGGRDKAGDFTVLRDLVRERVKFLILLGEAKEKIAGALGDVTETVSVDNLKDAVEVSLAKASRGDIVLLSPGCASFDMFMDFEDRGRKFKEAVKEVKGSELKVRY